MSVQIEILKADDEATLEKIVELGDVFAQESEIYAELDFSKPKFRNFIRGFAVSEDGVCLVGKLNGEVVGFAPAYVDQTYIDKMNFEIISIYVAPQGRNSGVGMALVNKLVEMFEALEAPYCQVSVCAFFKQDKLLIQRATEMLFKRKGFEQIGVILGKKGE